MPSTPLDDPHRKAPEVASSIPLGPDATHVPPGPREQLAEDIEVSKQHVNLLLPKLTLIRHGQSLFNAMWSVTLKHDCHDCRYLSCMMIHSLGRKSQKCH